MVSLQKRYHFIYFMGEITPFSWISVSFTEILVEKNIRVRAWQEEPDPEWGKYGPEMF